MTLSPKQRNAIREANERMECKMINRNRVRLPAGQREQTITRIEK